MPVQGACANNGCAGAFLHRQGAITGFLACFMQSRCGKLLLRGCEFYAIDVRLLSKTSGRDLLGVLCSDRITRSSNAAKTHYGGFQLHEDRFTKTESRRPFRRSDRGTFGGRRCNRCPRGNTIRYGWIHAVRGDAGAARRLSQRRLWLHAGVERLDGGQARFP